MKVTRSPGEIAADLPAGAAVSVPVEVLRSWQEEMHNAFELGVKSAGGTIIPDRSKFIEMAISQSALTELLDFAEAGENAGGGPFSPDLQQFLENVSIHRSRK